MRSKGVAQDTIRNAMEEFSTEDTSEALQKILQQKSKSVKGNSNYEIRTKLIRFALSRGFTLSEILKQLEDLYSDDN